MTSLLESLALSAQSYARRALDAYVTDQHSDFFLYAGLGVEHALKARLVRENAAFIAPRDGFLAAVTLWRAKDDSTKIPTGTPTIGGKEALRRVKEMDAVLGAEVASVAELFQLRNGEAHLGIIDRTSARRSVVSFLRAINALLRVDPETFWAPNEGFVRATLDETAAESSREVASKLAAARARYEQRRELLAEDQRAALDALIAADAERDRDDENFVVDCPACDSPASVTGENSLEWEVEYDREGPNGASPWVQFAGHYLYCRACGLELDGEEELQAADLETQWPNDEADLGEWLADYYSDD